MFCSGGQKDEAQSMAIACWTARWRVLYANGHSLATTALGEGEWHGGGGGGGGGAEQWRRGRWGGGGCNGLQDAPGDGCIVRTQQPGGRKYSDLDQRYMSRESGLLVLKVDENIEERLE